MNPAGFGFSRCRNARLVELVQFEPVYRAVLRGIRTCVVAREEDWQRGRARCTGIGERLASSRRDVGVQVRLGALELVMYPFAISVGSFQFSVDGWS